MSTVINIPQFLHHRTENTSSLECSGRTIGECLEELVARFPDAREILFDEQGELQKLLAIYLNRESAYPGELEKEVNDGDSIDIMYTIVGG